MENVIKRIVKYVLNSKYKEFEDVIYYNVYCVIDGRKFFEGDSSSWGTIKDSIRDAIKMSGIRNNVNIYIRFSDEK
jgi:hypothetical protein